MAGTNHHRGWSHNDAAMCLTLDAQHIDSMLCASWTHHGCVPRHRTLFAVPWRVEGAESHHRLAARGSVLGDQRCRFLVWAPHSAMLTCISWPRRNSGSR